MVSTTPFVCLKKNIDRIYTVIMYDDNVECTTKGGYKTLSITYNGEKIVLNLEKNNSGYVDFVIDVGAVVRSEEVNIGNLSVLRLMTK